MAAAATMSPSSSAEPWFERAGSLIVPRQVKRTDQARIVLAFIAAAGAVAYAVAGYVNRAWVGMDGNPGLFHLTAPALVIAGFLQVYLVVTGAHRPVAVFSAAGVQIHGYTLASSDITRVWIQRSPADGSAALMVGTTREDAAPALVAVPPGLMSESDLNGLFARVKQARAAEAGIKE